ncbi:hypothetical protein [Calothrix sp. PCC 6303]|uniref:hypothetical protein n=1 Tax=Calothrix sp. PCC 6303 TaxID=1170562 RepID=UPI0002A01B64|nr:hypothetical protein [Calothrix sp. PCC 6303]AFZ03537.1 hypothetical protein Cal6303_4637 [Calothrix sp. PCC 6303]
MSIIKQSNIENMEMGQSKEEDRDLRSQLHRTQAELKQLQLQLDQARGLIRGMESSKFWKLRTQWFKVKALFGYKEPNAFREQKSIAKNLQTTKPVYTKDPSGYYFLGMTTADEQAYTEEYTKSNYTGEGEIVELGCFIGSFSISLARGLEANSKIQNKDNRIHAHDIFIWDEYIGQIFEGHEIGSKYQPGDSFIGEYIDRISLYKQYIQIHEGDLINRTWEGGKIEFLLVDAMKSWELTNSCIQNFFPYLIAGKSLLHHQDFSYFWTTWIHLTMYRLREYFQPLYYVPECSVIFKYIKEIPSEILAANYSIDSFSNEEIEAAFGYSLSIVPDFMRPNIAAAKITTYFQKNDLTRARQELEKAKSIGLYRENSDYSQIEEWLR